MSSSQAAVARRHINLPGRKSGLPFSDAVLVGDTLYLAGRIGIDPVTGRAPADVGAEIKLLLDGVEAVRQKRLVLTGPERSVRPAPKCLIYRA